MGRSAEIIHGSPKHGKENDKNIGTWQVWGINTLMFLDGGINSVSVRCLRSVAAFEYHPCVDKKFCHLTDTG